MRNEFGNMNCELCSAVDKCDNSDNAIIFLGMKGMSKALYVDQSNYCHHDNGCQGCLWQMIEKWCNMNLKLHHLLPVERLLSG